ncbi:kinesin light chain [Colletotrichum graminicola M1.001]|uniref:Kinesin light chain n=1 Tax=Colletotrichum graminicola (strain M1.001 / M2 / FGSC 10212) TaxID=645133 RepID=E3QFE3_COLGM|nr:kinesin light chain [Colletotrichum graminicola M1.001]EFQ29581.1 kinesin light chain [Colletotrichum graminicola M1.001]
MSTVPVTARKKLARGNYRIGWICPLHVDMQAALAMLDEVHENLPQPCTDPTIYRLGSISGHNVVIASLHQPGNCTAAMVANSMQSTFRNLEFGLLVGTGGGVPTRSEAGMIRLSHVVVSKSKDAHSGAVYYSQIKAEDGVFKRTGYIDSPPPILLHAARSLEIDLEASEDCPISSNIERILSNQMLRSKYKHPGVSKDHMRGPEDEDTGGIIVHRGTIASGELLLRDAGLRDKLAKEHGVLCFEMEAAGALTDFRCLVIRGISNYCDALKNDDWHGYASAAAAAYARELFFTYRLRWRKSMTHVRPRHFIVPFTQNRDFLGREIFLEELRAKLCVDDRPRRLAITGLGGIGKTQVALQTAFWFKENRPTWSVFWVQAYSMSAFEKACSGIIDRSGIQVAKDEDPKETVQRFLNSRDSGNWLFIVDNADDGQTMFRSGNSPGISNFLPENEDGRILFTSRFRKLAFELAGKEVLELEKMTTSEARKFFDQVMPEELTRPIGLVEDLLAQLEHLPLAIYQAAAYLRNNCISTSIEDYLSTLRGTEKEAAGLLSREYRDHTRYDDEDIGHAVGTTWLVSFGQMEQMDDVKAAMVLLQFISQNEPTSIPMDLLPRRNIEGLHYASGILASFAFLDKRPGTNLLSMHRLVHLASRIWFEKK